MRVRYKLFPYPVLCLESDDYINNQFEVSFEIAKDINTIRFAFKVALADNTLKEMIDEEIVELIYHIECAKTLYRQIHITKELKYNLAIEEKNLNGKVDICCFIVAKQDIEKYVNKNFNEDYMGASFEILRGNILGFYNLPRVEFTKNVEELADVASIFSILRQENIEDGISIELNGEKIKVWLDNDGFSQYKNFAKSALYQPMIHAMIIFPALMYALDMIMKDGEEEYSEYRWFKGIERMLENSNMQFNKETIEQVSSYKLAQKLLNLPINRALKNMTHEGEDME